MKKIIKIWYFKNTHRDEFNDILYNIIYLYILVEKYGQSKFVKITYFQMSRIEGVYIKGTILDTDKKKLIFTLYNKIP